jgi:acyl carrier protein
MISELNQSLKINISFEDTLKIKKVGDILKICQKYKKK